MRVSRIALVVVALLSASTLSASHYQSQCPLSLADATPPATSFELSPHGVFRNGTLVHALRGQVLTTYTTNDVGNLQIVREDFIGSLAARESEGGVAFSNGHLFISSEAGLEIYDLRNVRVGGTAPVLVHRAAGFHYRRLAISGNRLAGLIPTVDLPCYPTGTSFCTNTIDIVDISTLTNPVRIGGINSFPFPDYRGFNDVAFNSGVLIAVSEEAVIAFDITNPGVIREISNVERPGRWLISNGADFLAVGRDNEIDIYMIRAGTFPFFTLQRLLTIPWYLAIDRANPIRFSRNAWYDEPNARLITLIDEVDPMSLEAARTIAFDVFDFRVPQYEGSVERVYEDVTLTTDDEVKHNPVAVGTYVYVIGESTGLQSWGSCGVATGRIELNSPFHLTCGGDEIHGWVTGPNKIINVELFLNGTSLGAATLGNVPRTDVSSPTVVTPWRISVNLDGTARGDYRLRALATDAAGTRRQFASLPIFFEGPGRNCSTPRRRAVR